MATVASEMLIVHPVFAGCVPDHVILDFRFSCIKRPLVRATLDLALFASDDVIALLSRADATAKNAKEPWRTYKADHKNHLTSFTIATSLKRKPEEAWTRYLFAEYYDFISMKTKTAVPCLGLKLVHLFAALDTIKQLWQRSPALHVMFCTFSSNGHVSCTPYDTGSTHSGPYLATAMMDGDDSETAEYKTRCTQHATSLLRDNGDSKEVVWSVLRDLGVEETDSSDLRPLTLEAICEHSSLKPLGLTARDVTCVLSCELGYAVGYLNKLHAAELCVVGINAKVGVFLPSFELNTDEAKRIQDSIPTAHFPAKRALSEPETPSPNLMPKRHRVLSRVDFPLSQPPPGLSDGPAYRHALHKQPQEQ